MINISVGGNSRTAEYILRNGETVESWSNIATEKKEIVSRITDFLKIETTGSKELGINANPRARGMTKLIVSLPNENTNEENKELLKEVLKKSSISDYPHVVSIHNGEKDGIENRHAHIMYFERNFTAGNSKKNRVFNGKFFFQNLKTEYQKTFGFTENENARNRIPTKNFENFQNLKSEQQTIKAEIEKIDKQIKNERFRERLNGRTDDSRHVARPEDGYRGDFKGITDDIDNKGDQSTNRGGESPRIDHKDLVQQLADNIREDERLAADKQAAGTNRRGAEENQHGTNDKPKIDIRNRPDAEIEKPKHRLRL